MLCIQPLTDTKVLVLLESGRSKWPRPVFHLFPFLKKKNASGWSERAKNA